MESALPHLACVRRQSCSQANVYSYQCLFPELQSSQRLFCCSLSLRSFESNHSSPSQAYHSSPTILVQVKGSVSILEGTVRYVFPTPTSGAFRFCGIPVQALVPGELRGIVLESFAVSSRLSCECSTIPRKPTPAKSKDVCVLLGSFVKSKDVALSFGLSS